MQVGHSARANSARATPQEDQELIRTLDLSLLARKNSFWSFAIRQGMNVLKRGYTSFDKLNTFELKAYFYSLVKIFSM